MTLDEFYDRLAMATSKFDIAWSIRAYGQIRGGTKLCSTCCPISSVDHLGPSITAFWGSVARDVGLMVDDRNLIVSAADNGQNHDPAIRRRLLEACGIGEKV